MQYTFTQAELLELLEQAATKSRQFSAVDEAEIACRVLHPLLAGERKSLPYQPPPPSRADG